MRTKKQNRNMSVNGGIAGAGNGVLGPFCLWSLAASRCLGPPLLCVTLCFSCGQKEILQHVLHYIQFLQRNIDVAKALLEFHTADGGGGAAGKSVARACYLSSVLLSGTPSDFATPGPPRGQSEEGVREDCGGRGPGAGPLRTGPAKWKKQSEPERAGMRRHVWNVWGQASRWVWLEGPRSIARTSAGS